MNDGTDTVGSYNSPNEKEDACYLPGEEYKSAVGRYYGDLPNKGTVRRDNYRSNACLDCEQVTNLVYWKPQKRQRPKPDQEE